MARKQKKHHYIYKTTNILSGRYYIGMHSTSDLNDGYLGSGTYLKRSLNKHGKENHSIKILEFLNSKEELANRERKIVNLNEIAKKDCMNMKVGGDGGFTSSEARLGAIATNKILKKKFEIDSDFKKRLYKKAGESNKLAYKEGRKQIQYKNLDWTGKHHTSETKRKMSDAKKGKYTGEASSQYGTCWVTDGNLNKKINKFDLVPCGWRLGRIQNK